MKVALFGGTGFVGKYIANALINSQHEVYTLIRPNSIGRLAESNKINVITGEINNSTALEQTMMNCSVVIYNIGIIREFPSKGITYKKLHLQYTKLVIDSAKKYNIKHFILMSANGVKEQGTSYQSTKFFAEEYLKKSNLNYTIFRPSLIFGRPEGDKEFCSELRDTMIKLPIPAPLFFDGVNIMNAGNFSMSPIHVENVADFFVKSICNEQHYMQTYLLGGLDKIKWKDIIGTIAKALRKNKFMIPAPVMIVKFIAFLFGRFSFFPITTDQLTMLMEGNICDSEQLFKDFQINPIQFSSKSISYLRKK